MQLENQILKNILDQAGLSYHKELLAFKQNENKEAYDPEQGKRIIHPSIITENMANQFFGMFGGRQDVYAKRSVNKESGKAAYYPQCDNFWTNVCHKKIKDGVNCKDCKNRSYKTIIKRDILNHLQGNNSECFKGSKSKVCIRCDSNPEKRRWTRENQLYAHRPHKI